MSVLSNVTRGIWARGTRAGFVVVIDFQLTFSFLVVEMEDCRHLFCSAKVERPGLEVFTYGCHAFARHYFHC